MARLNLPMICDWENRPRQRLDFVLGKRAVTKFEVLARLTNNSTRVKLTPVTGRSHQLRLHMLALGHPILGDKFYSHPQAKSYVAKIMFARRRIDDYSPHYRGNNDL